MLNHKLEIQKFAFLPFCSHCLPASSRLRPYVVWVRSLVPKLKNSACSARRPACSAARGSSTSQGSAKDGVSSFHFRKLEG